MEDNNNNNKNNSKKRNKKKKNKQTKTTEDDAVSFADQNGVIIDNNNIKESQNGDVDAEDGHDRHQNNGTEISISTAAEKQHWLQKEAILEEAIKQLQNENESHVQKEAILRNSIKQLQEENEIYRQKQVTLEEMVKELRNATHSALQNEVTLKETIKGLTNEKDDALQKEITLTKTVKDLRNENDSALHREATFKEEIQKLKYENDLQMQKEAGLENKIAQLQSEKEWCLQKEAGLEEKLQLLLDENAALGLKENTTKETIARMNVDVTRLRMQVVELEEFRNNLIKENQELKENNSDLKLQLQNLGTNISSASTSDELKKHALEPKNLESQIAAACALVDKLINENAELVEKVNELYVKLNRQSSAAEISLSVGNDLMPRNAEITGMVDSIPESVENKSIEVHNMESLETVPASGPQYAAESDSGEIVQIPLDDNELRDLELQVVESDKMEAVPISDAPLIGAPFRLISFVAKYVSGADLVNKDTLSPGS